MKNSGKYVMTSGLFLLILFGVNLINHTEKLSFNEVLPNLDWSFYMGTGMLIIGIGIVVFSSGPKPGK